MKIKTKIIIFILIVAVSTSVIFTSILYTTEKRCLIEGADQKIISSITIIKAMLPPDYHDKIVDANSVSPEQFTEIVDTFNKICTELELQYLWSNIKIGDKICFTTATSPDKITANNKHAGFFEIHRDPGAFTEVFATMKPIFSEFKNEWGHGKEAVDIWEEWDPDLIFMDIRMPAMNGYEATKRIRELEIRNSKFETRIIAVTASVLEDEREIVLSAGCDDIVRKPFEKREIFDVIQRYLGVRYVYKEDTPGPGFCEPDLSGKDKQKAFTPEALAALPDELLISLEHAVILGDAENAESLTQDIRSHNAALADALAALTDDFEYGKILKLIKQVRGGEQNPGSNSSGGKGI